jgi:hypothetical protein
MTFDCLWVLGLEDGQFSTLYRLEVLQKSVDQVRRRLGIAVAR